MASTTAGAAGSLPRRVRYAPGSELPAHVHGAASLCLTLRGSYVERSRGRSMRLEPGCAILCRAQEPHAQSFGPAGATKLILPLGDEHAARLEKNDRRDVARSAEFVRLGARLAAELLDPDPFSALAIEGLALEIHAHFLRLENGRSLPDRVRRAQAHLIESGGELTLGALADALGEDPVRLAVAFRRQTGQPIGQGARAARLRAAANRLAHSADPIAAIAAESGFYDQAHFTRAFRRQFGVTPGRYRRAVH